MVTVEVERVFSVSRERVWERFTDHAGWTRWAGAGRVHLAAEGTDHRDGVGCIRVITNPGIAVREEVTAFEPHERMEYRLLDNPGVRDHQAEVVFEDLGNDRTRVTWRCRFEPKIPGMSLPAKHGVAFFFARVLRRLERVL